MSADRPPLRVGLTGGIASGKSTVTRALEARGVPVLDADAVYHQLLREDAAMLQALRDRFGDGVFQPDGQLDRKALGAIVFRDPAALADLGAITHPRVRDRFLGWMDDQAAAGAPLAVVVIPLLFENGLERHFDTTVVIACAPATQRARLMAREGIDGDEADRRIASQMALTDKVARADHVLDNDGAPDLVDPAVERLLEALGQARAPGSEGP